MKNHKDAITSASRRGFAKSAIAVLAALPFFSALTNAQGTRGRRRGGRSERQSGAMQRVYTDRNEHDTPPPVLLMSGSCIFETESENDFSQQPDDSGGGNRRKYKIKPKGNLGDIKLAHVKILDGSGEMLFRFDNKFSQPLEVTINLDDREQMKLSAMADRLIVDLKKTKKLAMKMGELSMNPGKRDRFRYMDDPASGKDPAIKSVNVSVRGVTLDEIELDKLKSKGEELKVMLWWEKL